MKLQNKTALITGATSDIGMAIAAALASEGANLGLTGRNIHRLESLAQTSRAVGVSAKIFPTDLRDLSQLRRLAADVNMWSPPDIIVHVAGVWHGSDTAYAGVDLVDTPEDQILEVLDVGIRAPMILTRLLLPPMISRGSGKIVSISGTFASGGAGWLHYYVSKLALENFTVGLAQELRKHRIQVNAISPSDTNTEPLQRFFPSDAARALSPSEVGKLSVFFSSEDSDHITGQILVIKNKDA